MATVVSEISSADIAEYLRIDEASPSETQQIDTFLAAAKAYIKGYTGLDAAGVDANPDIMAAVYVLCQDMYDNRSAYVDQNNVNKTVESILNMHCVNLLPRSDEDIAASEASQ
jgi:uncharacterized phage protein (predicted DNA packaging)